MKNLKDNNMIRFKSITKKKDGSILVNFKAQGVKGETSFSASISVDISSLDDIQPTDSMEKIVEAAAHRAAREFKRSELQFEGIKAV